MNRFTGTIICMMTGMLAMAQQVYELDMPVKKKTIYSGHLKLGGSNPSGERIEVNSYYMSVGGKPVIPVMGEFHYSRYPECQWEEEILKMKAGGVTVIPTYVSGVFMKKRKAYLIGKGTGIFVSFCHCVRNIICGRWYE